MKIKGMSVLLELNSVIVFSNNILENIIINCKVIYIGRVAFCCCCVLVCVCVLPSYPL